ncbi:rod-determining factor RdfA [Natrinema soli]|uniref:Rod-determining factor RdfA n=1 Tax=Natrinema soli TaxID=1930624 RepID=A0ABD5SI57_9EURY|nr:rod-determining factor RdfA [Natrinema soli]
MGEERGGAAREKSGLWDPISLYKASVLPLTSILHSCITIRPVSDSFAKGGCRLLLGTIARFRCHVLACSPIRKVERNIEKYGLDGLNKELHRRYQEGASLRDLATVINKRVLETALQDANATVVGDVESIYEALRGNEVSVGRRAAVSSQLKQQGVPMDEVEDDFMSHQTVRDHLQTCLDRDTARRSRVTRSDAKDTIEWARSRCTAVIERTLTRLHDAGQLQAANIVPC